MCSLSNLKSDRKHSRLDIVARLVKIKQTNKKKTTNKKQKTPNIVILGTAGNECYIFHRDPFLTDTGNFKLCIYLKYLVVIQKSPYKLDFLYCIFLVSVIVNCLSEKSFLGWKGQTKVRYLLQRKYLLSLVPVETVSVCMEISWKLSLPAPPPPATALGDFFWVSRAGI